MIRSNWKEKATIATVFVLCAAHIVSCQQYHDVGVTQDLSWPVSLTFHETKTNALLGEALLKRMYARIGFTDNIIRAEVDNLFERLKDVIEKRLRKCERKRRRAGSGRAINLDSMYGHHNDTSTYSQRRARQQY